MQQVLRLLETRDYVQVAELSEAFSVSEVTVRSDLTAARPAGPRRPHPRRRARAPAGPVRGRVRPAPAARGRAQARDRPRRRGDGRRGRGGRARREHDRATTSRSSCARSASSSSSRTACSSRPRSPTRPGITVLVTGGMLRLSAMSLVGDLGTDVLRTTRINKGFLGARGLSLERGLMDLNPDEVRIKQEMADACEQVYGILDGTKWHRSALLSFVADETTCTGSSPTRARPPTRSRPGARRGVEVITAEPEPARAAAGPAARPPPRRPRRAGARLMATHGRRRPRRAERPRRASAASTASGSSSTRCTASRTSRSASRGTLHWDVLAPVPRGARRPARRCARAGSVDSVGVDSWGVDFGLARPARPAGRRTPSTTATRAAPPRSTRCSTRVPARELYERTGIQLLPINTIFELGAHGRRGRSGARGGARRCC